MNLVTVSALEMFLFCWRKKSKDNFDKIVSSKCVFFYELLIKEWGGSPRLRRPLLGHFFSSLATGNMLSDMQYAIRMLSILSDHFVIPLNLGQTQNMMVNDI